MSAAMAGRRRKMEQTKKKHLLKRPKAVTQNLKLKIAFLQKYFFGGTTFLYSSSRSSAHHQSFF